MKVLKIALAACIGLLMTACGSSTYVKPDGSAAELVNATYYVEAVKLVYDESNMSIEGLPDAATVETAFLNAIKQELIEQNIVANSSSGLACNFQITYQRQVAGSGFGLATGLGVPIYGYQVSIQQNGVTVASASEDVKILDKGMFGNLASVGDWFDGMNPEQEAEDIRLIAKKIVAELAQQSR